MLKVTRLSTIRFINDIIDEIKGSHPTQLDIMYQDWDAHADLKELPNKDMIGLSGFGITEDDKTYEIVFGILLCTYNDPNLFRVTDFADVFFRAMHAQKQFPIFNSTTGLKAGVAAFQLGTAVSPVQRVEIRPTIQITASAVVAPDASIL